MKKRYEICSERESLFPVKESLLSQKGYLVKRVDNRKVLKEFKKYIFKSKTKKNIWFCETEQIESCGIVINIHP